MHSWPRVHSIEPSFFFFFLNPRGRQTLAKLPLQPHWLRKQTGGRCHQVGTCSTCLLVCHPAQHPRETEKPNQTHKWFLDLFPAVLENSRCFQQQYLVEPETWPIMHGESKDMDFNSKKGGGGHTLWFLLPVCSVLENMDFRRWPLNTGRHSFC